MPVPGQFTAHLLSPTLVEVVHITTKEPDPAPPREWNFAGEAGSLPSAEWFTLKTAGEALKVTRVGFKRRVLYAPLKKRDLRIANYLYLQLATPLKENGEFQVLSSNQKLWPNTLTVKGTADSHRWSPVLHVNQTGYMPSEQKLAMVGYYLGTLGEMQLAGTNGASGTPASKVAFQIIDEATAREAFSGMLMRRTDSGYSFACYQQVYQADFSALKKPGRYRLCVPGIGFSFPFYIEDGVAAAFARTYALGLYHQRCGTSNSLPFTRFTHGPCHTAPAETPDMTRRFSAANESLEKETANFKDNPRHTAPRLKDVNSSLYPFVKKGNVDVSGGHHDAGDYSKYTINSAAFVHHLVFAADALPGVSDLDNLGLPESGDGKSDVLQEAKWETDFLVKMQDSDGGFYFLVYPREREYENDVIPDHGDPQVVFPKTTSATAAAVAALAQTASSPTFQKQFPDAAKIYLAAANKGWEFLERAIAKFGKDGAYQKITHYGDEFMHDDELAWAACEMFLATKDPKYHKLLLDWLRPTDPAIRRWGWWRLYEAYGCAERSYAFAARTGRVKPELLSPLLLEACENEVAEAGNDQLRRASANAYGTSFPIETKRAMAAGWYFSGDAAFDLAVACQLPYPSLKDPRQAMRGAVLSNLNYEQGCNPVNITYLTGLGWKRQREIVHQFAQNDLRVLPPTGIPLGNIQAGFGWNYLYNKELDALSFPPDGSSDAPYPFYDRWGDGFNLTQEFVILNQARALGYLCWLMAGTPLKTQPWKSANALITSVSTAGSTAELTLRCAGLDLSKAFTVWEAGGGEPSYGFSASPTSSAAWVEAEAQLPDGRRVFGVHNGK